MACAFCKTGTLPFSRNLKAAEMVEQFLYLNRVVKELHPKEEHSKEEVSNIVIMGMGEPFLNFTELEKALRIFTSLQDFALSPRRVTVSTSGVVSGVRAFADSGITSYLAVSLCTADESLRARLMPVTKTNPLAELKAALEYYQNKARRRITLELPLLRELNTRKADVLALKSFMRGLDVVVNLIPWNPVPGMLFEGKPLGMPVAAELTRFEAELSEANIKYTRRRRRGRSVNGACGQLGVTAPPDGRPDSDTVEPENGGA
jgi:23S rRNA (adenine2503-C2)-methyltransferase